MLDPIQRRHDCPCMTKARPKLVVIYLIYVKNWPESNLFERKRKRKKGIWNPSVVVRKGWGLFGVQTEESDGGSWLMCDAITWLLVSHSPSVTCDGWLCAEEIYKMLPCLCFWFMSRCTQRVFSVVTRFGSARKSSSRLRFYTSLSFWFHSCTSPPSRVSWYDLEPTTHEGTW